MSQETILLAIYNENATQARQHELFRQAITAVVGGIAGAVIGTSVKEGPALLKSPLLSVGGAFLMIVGVFGLLATVKHYERNRMHIERMRQIRVHLQTLPYVSPNILSNINAAADFTHNSHYSVFSRTRLNAIWNAFDASVIVGGAALCVLPHCSSPAAKTRKATPAAAPRVRLHYLDNSTS